MSFAFDWQAFSCEENFLSRVRGLLTSALNKNRPQILEDTITVPELEWGSEPPRLEILEIGDLASDRFRGIFKLNYAGSARITLATKVQANLLNVYAATAPDFTLPTFVEAPASFPIPLYLTLSDIKLSGIVILVFSKAKGLTLVFRNDPLQSIKVNSSLDQLPGIAPFLQSQIETHIRNLFREELPAILYAMSLQWKPNPDERPASVPPQLASPEKSVRFVDIDEEQRFSIANILRLETMNMSRRTLAVKVSPIPTAVYRTQLKQRRKQSDELQPVGILTDSGFERAHIQASKMASRASHKPKRRVLRIGKQNEQIAPLPLTPLMRPSSAPPMNSPEHVLMVPANPRPTSPNLIQMPKAVPMSAPIPMLKRSWKTIVAETKAALASHEFTSIHGPPFIEKVEYHENVDDLPPAYVA